MLSRAEQDAFSAGVCAVLTLVRIHEGGVGTIYEEAVETTDGRKLEGWPVATRTANCPSSARRGGSTSAEDKCHEARLLSHRVIPDMSDDVLEIRARERSWALSVFLGKIDQKELARIVGTMAHEDANRLIAVVEGFRDDLAIRDLIGPHIVDEDQS